MSCMQRFTCKFFGIVIVSKLFFLVSVIYRVIFASIRLYIVYHIRVIFLVSIVYSISDSIVYSICIYCINRI